MLDTDILSRSSSNENRQEKSTNLRGRGLSNNPSTIIKNVTGASNQEWGEEQGVGGRV